MKRGPIPQTQPPLLPKIIIEKKKKNVKPLKKRNTALCKGVLSSYVVFSLIFLKGNSSSGMQANLQKEFSFGMQIIIVMLPTPLREYSNDTTHWSSYFHLQQSNIHRFTFMTPEKQINTAIEVLLVGKSTIHDLTVTGECVQLLCKATLGQFISLLYISPFVFVGSVMTWTTGMGMLMLA